jgi:hypothetical protein
VVHNIITKEDLIQEVEEGLEEVEAEETMVKEVEDQ